MLTKSDLSQIQKIVQTETRKIVREETPTIVRNIITEETPGIVQKQLKPIKEDIAQIRKDIKFIVSFFDREYVALRRRVERIEEHLQLAPISS